MSFSNMQLTKKDVIFKYAINKKHDITFLYNLLIYDIIYNDNTRRI